MPISVPQLTYTQFQTEGLEGMPADGSDLKPVVDTMIADVALDCARGVVTGGASALGDPDRIKLPTIGTDVSAHFKGISMYVASKMPIAGSANRFAIKDAVPVMRKGRIYVLPEGDMVDDGAVFVVNGSGAGTAGKFRGDANGGAATTLGNNAVIRRGATVASGKLAVIEINLP